jgi:hypothetical protein
LALDSFGPVLLKSTPVIGHHISWNNRRNLMATASKFGERGAGNNRRPE